MPGTLVWPQILLLKNTYCRQEPLAHTSMIFPHFCKFLVTSPPTNDYSFYNVFPEFPGNWRPWQSLYLSQQSSQLLKTKILQLPEIKPNTSSLQMQHFSTSYCLFWQMKEAVLKTVLTLTWWRQKPSHHILSMFVSHDTHIYEEMVHQTFS